MMQKIALLVFILLTFLVSLFFTFLLQKKPSQTAYSEAVIIKNQCQTNTHKDMCYTDAFAQMTKTHTIAFTLSVLTELKQLDSVATGCHFIAHVIAAEEVKKDPEHWEDVLTKIPIAGCTGGFLMGIME